MTKNARFNELAENLKEMNARIRKIKDEMAVESRSVLNESFQEFFTANPEFKSVFWTQYTPHFNDGDECFFSVNEVWAKLVLDTVEDDEEGSDIPDPAYRVRILEHLKNAQADDEEYLKDPEGFTKKNNRWNNKKYSYKPRTPYFEKELAEHDASVEKLGGIKVAERLSKAHKDINNVISYINPEFMEMMFGDHVRVEVSLDKHGNVIYDVEDYEHD